MVWNGFGLIRCGLGFGFGLVWVQVCFVRFPFCLDLVLGFVLFGLGLGLVWRSFHCFGTAVPDVSRFFHEIVQIVAEGLC